MKLNVHFTTKEVHKHSTHHDLRIEDHENWHNNKRICQICYRAVAPYRCPKCDKPYCNIECYRAHGTSCTERFYEQHVKDDLSIDSIITDADKVKKMKEIIDREENEVQLIERMEELALVLSQDQELSMDMLTKEEQDLFLKEIHNGEMGKCVEKWTPWWKQSIRDYRKRTKSLRERGQAFIQTIREPDDQPENDTTIIESGNYHVIKAHALPLNIATEAFRLNLPNIQTLCPKPSPHLQWNVLDIVYAYVNTMELYNGNWMDCELEAVEEMISLSSVLNPAKNATFPSLELVWIQCHEELTRQCASYLSSSNIKKLHASMKDSVECIVAEPTFLIDVLYDSWYLFKNVHLKIKKKSARRRIMALVQKLYFYLVWANSTFESRKV